MEQWPGRGDKQVNQITTQHLFGRLNPTDAHEAHSVGAGGGPEVPVATATTSNYISECHSLTLEASIPGCMYVCTM